MAVRTAGRGAGLSQGTGEGSLSEGDRVCLKDTDRKRKQDRGVRPSMPVWTLPTQRQGTGRVTGEGLA